ncbi:MAG: Fic family protein [Psychrosphaera sp.]|nr:Fic family protein [Psychrosphaera sp.]
MRTIKPNKPKALMLAQREVATFIYDAVQLEGINFTLPEIQTLMEGVTVGGHALSDQQVAVNQSDAWKRLFGWLKQDEFVVCAEKACQLHAIAGKEEALEWGRFRSGGVTIAGTDYMPPKAAELGGYFDKMIADMALIADIYDQAIHLFLTMARCQFFYDVNKRMGRFMMNGLLLSKGYPAINLPFTRRQEFNELMLAFYASGEQQPMNQFLRTCLDERVIAIMNE